MNYSYQEGKLTIECNPEIALELIAIITKGTLITSPLKTSFERGISFTMVKGEISPSMLNDMVSDSYLAEYLDEGKKLAFVKRIKELTNLGLKDAKQIADCVFTDFGK